MNFNDQLKLDERTAMADTTDSGFQGVVGHSRNREDGMNAASTGSNADSARLGLAKEMLQVIFGLDGVTIQRVLRLIRASESAAKVKTPNMKQRIGHRSTYYLRNAIDLARNEGNEYHNEDPDLDDSKKMGWIEPGHKHDKGSTPEHPNTPPSPNDATNRRVTRKRGSRLADVPENQEVSFKNFLCELQMDVDLSDPAVATNQVRQAAKMSPDRAANQNVKNARDDMRAAQDADQASTTKQIDLKIAALSQQLAMLQQRKATMMKNLNGI